MKEKREKRINLSLTEKQYIELERKAKLAELKLIKFVTLTILGATIYTATEKLFRNQMNTDYRKQIGFLKMLLRDCELTSEASRIAEATINDFTHKVEQLENDEVNNDKSWNNHQENKS